MNAPCKDCPKRVLGCHSNCAEYKAYSDTRQQINKQRRGEWVFHKDGSATCNRCGTTQKNVWDVDNFQSYCGHCGAKMKGGAK